MTDLPLNSIVCGDARFVLSQWPERSVHGVVLSPPYWALRKYQGVCDTIWGGDAGCAHEWGDTLPRVGNEYREGLGGVCDGRADKGAIRTSLGGARPSTAGNTTPSGFQQKSQAGADGALAQTKWAGTHRVGRNDADRKWKGNDASEVSSGQYCQNCGAWRGQWGLEPSLGQYVANSVEFFGAVHRVMRDDATLWLNLGDSYAGTGSGEGTGNFTEKDNPHAMTMGGKLSGALKPLDLCGVPWAVATALRDQLGFYLRSAVVWAKGLSLCPTYSGSVMPESVAGTRWERHRVRTSDSDSSHMLADRPDLDSLRKSNNDADRRAQMSGSKPLPSSLADCPGCPKCESTGGWVLRLGSWRPTNAYEFLFEFTKSRNYYGDGEAVRERGDYPAGSWGGKASAERASQHGVKAMPYAAYSGSRNLRNVLTVDSPEEVNERWKRYWGAFIGALDADHDAVREAMLAGGLAMWPEEDLKDCIVLGPEPTALAHYASFPSKLPSLAIQASTSEHGVCPTCGAPWARMIEVDGRSGVSCHPHENDAVRGHHSMSTNPDYARRTVGWRPTCDCYNSAISEWGGCAQAAYKDGDDPDVLQKLWEQHLERAVGIESSVILDPCMGTGRTALAARRLGRNFVGCDPSETYCEMARAQVQAEEPDALVPAPHAPDAPPPAGSLLALFGAKP